MDINVVEIDSVAVVMADANVVAATEDCLRIVTAPFCYSPISICNVSKQNPANNYF
jgi:hypothetical protein